MKKLRVIVCFSFVAIICLMSARNQASAHNVKQAGTLLEEYISSSHSPLYGKSFVGGEAIGWSINEDHHLSGPYMEVKYSIPTGVAEYGETMPAMVQGGAEEWSDFISFVQVDMDDDTAMGTTEYKYSGGSDTGAGIVPVQSNGTTGHRISWTLEINVQYIDDLTEKTFAHEFGHVIGLNDLYSDTNKSKLMYGKESRYVGAPASADERGARVILGLHTSHNWDYTYHSTYAGVNRHYAQCGGTNGCRGIRGSGQNITLFNCTYGTANNRCLVCGADMFNPIASHDEVVIE